MERATRGPGVRSRCARPTVAEPLSVKDPTRECFLSIPTVVGVQGAETVLEIRPHLNYAEAQKYDATADTLEPHVRAAAPGRIQSHGRPGCRRGAQGGLRGGCLTPPPKYIQNYFTCLAIRRQADARE